MLSSRPHVHLPPPSPRETLQWMQRMAVDSQMDAGLREHAERIVRGLWPHDYISEYAAVLNWVRRNIRYSRDPVTIEQVKSPQATLATGTGDCDDMAVVIAGLIGHLGGQTRFVAGAFKAVGGRPVLSHVWAEAFDPVNKAWIVLDPVPGRRVQQMLGRTLVRIEGPAVG